MFGCALFCPLYTVIVLLNTAYNLTVPFAVLVKFVTLCEFVYVTDFPSSVALHPANVHPLGAVPLYAVKFLAVSYVCELLVNFVNSAVVVPFP